MQTRAGNFDGSDASSRQIHFSFSSESPIPRRFGREVLSHAPGALDSERLDRGAVPFLKDHNWSLQAGQITSYQLGAGKNYAVAKLFSTPLGEELLTEINQGRKMISVGYVINQMELTEETPGQENNLYTVTKYSVIEISSVSVAADINCQVDGRSLDTRTYECRVLSPRQKLWSPSNRPLGKRDPISRLECKAISATRTACAMSS